MISELAPLIKKFTSFAQNKMNFKRPPKLFLKNDLKNSKSMLGRTAHYDPSQESITIYVSGRHPKDILRSYAHELVHHSQNLRGDLSPEKCGNTEVGYAQNNQHLRNMEKEAYLVGNMCFRDWEDSCKLSLKESRFLKEKKIMSNKITTSDIIDLIKEAIEEVSAASAVHGTPGGARDDGDCGCPDKLNEEPEELEEKKRCAKCGKPDCDCEDEDEVNEEKKPDDDGDGVPNWADKKPGKDDHEDQESEEEPEEEPKGSKPPKPPRDPKDPDGDKPGNHDQDKPKNGKANESRIVTPEQEQALYENRFNKRNEKLFEKLLNKWAK